MYVFSKCTDININKSFVCTNYIQCLNMNIHLYFWLPLMQLVLGRAHEQLKERNHLYFWLPLMKLVLGRAHEQLKERNKAPSVVGEQLVRFSTSFTSLTRPTRWSSSSSRASRSASSWAITSAILRYLHAPRWASASSLSGHQHVAHERTEHRQLTATSAPSMLRESRYPLPLRTCNIYIFRTYQV